MDMPRLCRSLASRSLQVLLFLLGIFSLSLLAVQPFTLNQMPESADGLLQLHRTVAVDYSLRVDNPWWLRYSSGLVYGYGAPLFNYFPALSYYLGSGLHSLGFSFVQSWLWTMVLYTWLAAIGMFLLGRLWTGSRLGGWVAAIAFVYAPFYLFDGLARGSTPEMAALALLPFVFYGWARLAFYGRRLDFVIALLAFALFIPMHTLMTLHGTGLLALYALFLWWRAADKKGVLLRLLLAGGLALTLTAFYWLPALMETDAIKINLIAANLEHIDVRRHLRPLHEILAFPHTADPTQQNQSIPISLGWVQLLLSGAGLILTWKEPYRRYRGLLLTLWGMVLLLIMMNMPVSAWLWENLPLIAYTQFPWRLLGLASFLLALMTAVSVRLIWTAASAGWRRSALVGMVSLSLLVYAIPWTYTLYYPAFPLEDIRDVHQFERDTGQLALSSYSEYLPVTTDERQLDANRLIERFAAGDIIPRLLPSGTLTLISQRWAGTSATLRLDSAIEQTVELDWLYVPGWAADMDGQSLEVFPSPRGLVAVDVPMGEFDLRIALQPTPVQSLSLVFSLLGAVGVLAAVAGWRDMAGSDERQELQSEARVDWLVVGICLAVFLLKALVLDAADTAFKATRFGDAEVKPLANFGEQIDLLRVDMPSAEMTGRWLEIKLYWRLHESPIERDYSSILRMRNPQGRVVAEASSFAPGGLASGNWLPGAYVEDVIQFEIPQFTPQLDEPYRFEASLFDSESLVSLSVINAAGNPQDVKYEIGRRLYRLSEQQFQAEQIQAFATGDEAGRYAALYELPKLPDAATAGDELSFDWTWQKLRQIPALAGYDLLAQVLWLNEGDNVNFASALRHLVDGHRFHDWQTGEINRGHHAVIVPPNIPAGGYQIGIRLLDSEQNPLGEIIRLEQQMSLHTPQRYFAAPDFARASSAEWGNGIVLRGFSLNAPAELRLVWQTKRMLSDSLRLFVHVLDEQARIAAQWDGVPTDWTRPTTGWIPGEYVTTTHRFALPMGEYRLRLGWYEPTSGERAGVGDADALTLAEVLVVE